VCSSDLVIDQKTVKLFKDATHLEVYAQIAAGDHRFDLNLDKPATNTSMSSRDDFKYCRQ
jgi:hypothetical protein